MKKIDFFMKTLAKTFKHQGKYKFRVLFFGKFFMELKKKSSFIKIQTSFH